MSALNTYGNLNLSYIVLSKFVEDIVIFFMMIDSDLSTHCAALAEMTGSSTFVS